MCQCPHGLVPHFYQQEQQQQEQLIKVSMPSRASTSLLRRFTDDEHPGFWNVCQCPHGLVPHCYGDSQMMNIPDFGMCVNALTG